MILFPAIDIKNGSCVRLVQGKMEEATVFNEDPVDQAKIFESKGCKWIHVVDLDGAIKGHSVNQKIIKEIILSVNIKIQLGGGIRNNFYCIPSHMRYFYFIFFFYFYNFSCNPP